LTFPSLLFLSSTLLALTRPTRSPYASPCRNLNPSPQAPRREVLPRRRSRQDRRGPHTSNFPRISLQTSPTESLPYLSPRPQSRFSAPLTADLDVPIEFSGSVESSAGEVGDAKEGFRDEKGRF